MSEITWNDLTAGQLESLRQAATNKGDFFSGELRWLIDNRLIYMSNTGINLTDLGRAVLAQAPVADNAPANKPPVITARDFVRDDYAGKIARGECVVTLKGGVTPIAKIVCLEEGAYQLTFVQGGGGTFDESEQFTVTWQLATEPAQAAGDVLSFHEAELERIASQLPAIREQYDLRAELATVKAERDAALKQVKALKRKSGLDDGFINFLTTKGEPSNE